MRKSYVLAALLLLFIFVASNLQAQTSWTGATSNSWKLAANWTNGVPDATKDVFIGDINFTGSQPTLPAGVGSGTCKSLTIGAAAKVCVLTVLDDLTVLGTVTIGANGTINHNSSNFILSGNWSNSGVYAGGTTLVRVYFSGAAQTIGGTTVTNFKKLYVSTGSSITLARNINVATTINLAGTFDPTAAFTVLGTGGIDMGNNAVLKVQTGTFAGNYALSGLINPTSNTAVVDYASSAIPQTITNAFNYRDLRVSGATTKTLAGNTNIISDLFITGGAGTVLELLTFTINRTAAGGSLTMAAGSSLRIGGTNGFPANYSTRTLASTSTVEYYGTNQTVASLTYGHLIFTSTSAGAVVKTLQATAFTVVGNFTATSSTNTMSFAALNAITVTGSVTLSSLTAFDGSTFSHAIKGNWTNNGTYSGCNGTITSSGASSVWSGSGTNSFGNLVIAGNGTTVDKDMSLSLCGNFSTSGGGTFTHNTAGTGTFTMSGAAKTISGSNIILDDVILTGPATISTTSTLTIAGSLTATGTLTATAGTISLTGTGKTITGAGALQFFALNVPGTISIARSMTLLSNFSIAGSFTASAGVITFNGTSTFSGIANVFDIAISAAKTLIMGANATLGIGGTETLGGGFVFNVTTNTPNTVNYNSAGAQTINLVTFNNLTLSTGGVKTPSGGKTVNGDFTISAATTFAASTFTHTLGKNLINNGTFTPSTSTVQLTGASDISFTGVTAFNNLIVNKGSANFLTLNNNISVVNLTMTLGTMMTGTNSVTITATRTGNGIIIGTITRTHAFASGNTYTFEGPNNFITFVTAGTVTSVTVVVTIAQILNFITGSSINRSYQVTVAGAGYNATMRLHYQQAEVNGNAEGSLTLWNDSGIGFWINFSKSANDITNNWVEQTGLTNLSNKWTLSDGGSFFNWTGAMSTSWTDPLNWSTLTAPTINDVVRIGHSGFTNQPTITTSSQVKGLNFGSNQPATLTFGAGGSLIIQGNLDGTWTGAATHTINVGSRAITTFGDIVLSDGTATHVINLNISTGSVSINGSLTQVAGAAVNITGAGSLLISENYVKGTGAFSAGTGTVIYNGSEDQVIANVAYNNLEVDKSDGVALSSTPLTLLGSFLIGTPGGEVDLGGTLTVAGNVDISVGTMLRAESFNIILGGNWSAIGTFDPGNATVTFNGTGSQTVTGGIFNNLVFNKVFGTATLLGDLTINGDFSVSNGTMDATSFNVTRSTTGGTVTLGSGTLTRFSGSVTEFSNFSSIVANAASTVEYYGTAARNIPATTFGNLIISGGGANAKTMTGPTVVQGNLTVSTGATLTAPNSTLQVTGNVAATGALNTSTGTIVLAGVGKTISGTGTITYNNVIVNGSYDVISGNLIFNGYLEVTPTGDLDLGSATVTSFGDLTNSGILFSSGAVTFAGTQVQTLHLLNAVSSTSTGIINFNGTFSPVLNSTSSPSFATVNINNTSPIIASQGWNVAVAMNVAAGATWNGSTFTHNFLRNFSNSGSVSSSGAMQFIPTTPATINLGANFISTGKVLFGGTGQITLSGSASTFGAIDITNTNAAGVTAPAGWTLTDDIWIDAGCTVHGSTFTHTIAGQWTNDGTFEGGTSTVTFTSSAGTDEIVGSGTNVFNNIVFSAGSQITIISPITMTGSFTNNATSLLLQFGKATFTGTTLASIGGATITTFDDLEVAKTATSVQLSADAIVDGTLILTSGVMDLNAHILNITNSSNTSIERTAGYIQSENTAMTSKLNWQIDADHTAHVFPFGTLAGVYIPFTFTATSGDAGLVSLATYGVAANNKPYPPGVLHVADQFGNDNSANTVDRFFQVNVSGTPVVTMTLTASPAEVGTITTLRAQRWNSANWDPAILGQTSTATSATVTGVTTFSPWAIAGNLVPLPVTLTSFEAKQVKNEVDLQWVTETEINNDHFEVEKSLDGRSFFKIATVQGAGNSSEAKVYHQTDYELRPGKQFYRLRQVDFDKASMYSKVVVVTIGDVSPIEFSVFPNPVADLLKISNNSPFSDNLSVTFFDPSGKVVMKHVHEDFGGNELLDMDVSALVPGVYLVQIDYSSYRKSFRITRKN